MDEIRGRSIEYNQVNANSERLFKLPGNFERITHERRGSLFEPHTDIEVAMRRCAAAGAAAKQIRSDQPRYPRNKNNQSLAVHRASILPRGGRRDMVTRRWPDFDCRPRRKCEFRAIRVA